jgi:DNA repair exonuclease SbcCD ATPase subunit
MDILNKVGETITNKGKDVAKKAKDLAEIASLRTQITVQESSVNRVLQELGKMYYEQHKAGTSDDITEKCSQIDTAVAEIERLKQAVMTLKGIRKCPVCGADVDESAIYCSKCGVVLPVPETAPEEPVAEDIEVPEEPKAETEEEGTE